MSVRKNTPLLINNENIEGGPSQQLKGTLSARSRIRPKQAFGELKNIIHNNVNPTPLKSGSSGTKTKLLSSVKPQAKTNHTFNTKTIEKSSVMKTKPRLMKSCESDDPFYIFAQNVALSDDEIHRIINAKDDFDEDIPEPPSCKAFDIWCDSQDSVNFLHPIILNKDKEIPVVSQKLPELDFDKLLNDLLLE